jgi:hypothetical protein
MLDNEKPSYKGENPFKKAVKQIIDIEKEDYIMEMNEIKKALYKQKPIAEYGYDDGGNAIYSAEVEIDGIEEEVQFKIPNDELKDDDGNHIFGKEEPAQLLIRWIVL